MAKLVIFGIGKIAQVVFHHFSSDSEHQIVGFTTDRDYVPKNGTYEGLPVVAFEEVEKRFAPQSHALFVAIGYHGLNQVRADRLKSARQKGYATTSYVSSQNKHWRKEQLGENCFVMAGEPLQPKSKIGDNCFIWTNATVGHHSTVGDHCWIVSGAVIGGHSQIGDYCFLGLGATVGHEISIGQKSLIGAGALVTKDAPDESVYIQAETPRFRLSSAQFLKMNTLK
jgi:sugar O-acyltransferase (sialic acid O-acetyltransferase NeuD family)